MDGSFPDLHRRGGDRIPTVRCTLAAKAAGDHHPPKEEGALSIPSPCETGQSSTGSRSRKAMCVQRKRPRIVHPGGGGWAKSRARTSRSKRQNEQEHLQFSVGLQSVFLRPGY